jgi:hypothetical protein
MVCDIHPMVGNLLAAKVATGLVPNRGSVRRYAHGPLRRSADVRISRCERAIRNAPIICRQAIFGRDREKRSRGEPMKGTPYPEEWVEGYNHWFSGPPHLRLDGLAGFVRILVSRRGSRQSGVSAENALRRLSAAASAQTCSSDQKGRRRDSSVAGGHVCVSAEAFCARFHKPFPRK